MTMQEWKIKKFFTIENTKSESTYIAVPCAFFLQKHIVRIIYSSRDNENRSTPFFIDLNLNDLKLSKAIKCKMEPSKLGSFDDSGVMPTSIINFGNGKLWLYYIGWNLCLTVPFRNSLGLAVSEDNGMNFTRMFEGPILDRSKTEPHFNASACVMKDESIFKIWYLSCVGWESRDGKIVHKYHIKYAESKDGINWDRSGIIAIDFKYSNEYAISVPRVIKDENGYKMWYSYRGGSYSELYRIGYAESNNGINWNRLDEVVELKSLTIGLDNETQCYPFIFDYNNKRYMLYNGNDYGKTGFGLAILK